MKAGNLFRPAGAPEADEFFEELARGPDCRVERIVSHDHASPEGFWYDQEEDEFVVLLRGTARLEFEGEGEAEPQTRLLQPGDWILIPAHRRHRVAATSEEGPSVWLAVFWPAVDSSPST